MSVKTLIAVAAAAPLMTACISMSRSEAVAPVAADIAREGRVETVSLTNTVDADVGPDFKSIFESEVKAKLDACAQGSRPLTLEASVNSYSRTNPVITTVLIGRNRIRGEAVLKDAATGAEVGRYRIGKTIVGGRVAIVEMGPARKQLSEAFGDEVCKQAFAKETAASS